MYKTIAKLKSYSIIIGHCDLILWFIKGKKIYEHDALGYKSSWSYRLTKTEAVDHAVM